MEPSDVIEIEDGEDEQETEVRDELYCVLETQVVGVQYYTGRYETRAISSRPDSVPGMVGAGEEVRLVREPHNQYDRCALLTAC